MIITIVCFMVYLTLLILFFSLISGDYFSSPTRFSHLFSNSILNSLVSVFNSFKLVTSLLFVSLILFLLFINVLGNIPLTLSPSMYYSVTVTLSLTFWLSIMLVVSYTQLNDFIAHMLPYGSPSALILFLPLVEIFSHLIRPLTLMIRLSTNLSSGHIMIFMFSFFSVSSNILTFIIAWVLIALFVLEICISALQAYIFTSLLSMYLSESHN